MYRPAVITLLLLLAISNYMVANEGVYALVMAHPRTGVADWTGQWIPNPRDTGLHRDYPTFDEVRRVRVSNHLFEVSFEEGRQYGGKPARMMGSEVRKTKTSELAIDAACLAIICLGVWFVPPLLARAYKVVVRRRTVVTSSHT